MGNETNKITEEIKKITKAELIQDRLFEEIEYYFTETDKQERQDRVKESMVISKLASNFAQFEVMRLSEERIKLGKKENIRKRKRYEG